MIFSFNKMIKYSLFIFIFHICAKFQTKKKKELSWHMYLNVFNHIVTFWKNYTIFLCMMGAIIILGKNSFKFSFVGYALMTKSLGLRCTFEEVAKKKKKMSKDEYEYFYNQIRMNNLTLVSKGQNSLKLLYSLQWFLTQYYSTWTISATKCRAIN
jgi:hypothetical protein